MSDYDFSDSGITDFAHELIKQHGRNHARQQTQWDAIVAVKDLVGSEAWAALVERFAPQPVLTPEVALDEARKCAQEYAHLSTVDLSGMYCGDDDAIIYRAEAARYYAIVYMEIYMLLLAERKERE